MPCNTPTWIACPAATKSSASYACGVAKEGRDRDREEGGNSGFTSMGEIGSRFNSGVRQAYTFMLSEERKGEPPKGGEIAFTGIE